MLSDYCCIFLRLDEMDGAGFEQGVRVFVFESYLLNVLILCQKPKEMQASESCSLGCGLIDEKQNPYQTQRGKYKTLQSFLA